MVPRIDAIPGDSIAEETIIGGMLNFLSIYNFTITARVLLSWFPQAQGMSALRPLYSITDPYLNVFRSLPLQFGGLDLSIIPAFLLHNFAQSSVAGLALEKPVQQIRARAQKGRARLISVMKAQR